MQRFGEFVGVDRHGFVAELVMDRPKAMNAVSTAMADSLAAGVCRAGRGQLRAGGGAQLHP